MCTTRSHRLVVRRSSFDAGRTVRRYIPSYVQMRRYQLLAVTTACREAG